MLHVGDIGVRTVCILPSLLCVDGKTDTGVYTYWFLPCFFTCKQGEVSDPFLFLRMLHY